MHNFAGFIAVGAGLPLILFVILGILVIKKKARQRPQTRKR